MDPRAASDHATLVRHIRQAATLPHRPGLHPEADDTRDIVEPPYTPAAVLVPFILGSSPGVLLTRRTSHLAKHAGQVSFPGGRIDADDASPEHAALREAHEEIGLDPALVTLAGRLPDYLTGTGYRITPVLGLLPTGANLADLNLTLSPHEVDCVFELKLADLLNPSTAQRRSREWRGRERFFWVVDHPEHYVWGATAAILVGLAARLRHLAAEEPA